MVGAMTVLALVLVGCGSPPEPKQKTPEELAKEREKLNRKRQENIDTIMKRTLPKNPGQDLPDAVPVER